MKKFKQVVREIKIRRFIEDHAAECLAVYIGVVAAGVAVAGYVVVKTLHDTNVPTLNFGELMQQLSQHVPKTQAELEYAEATEKFLKTIESE